MQAQGAKITPASTRRSNFTTAPLFEGTLTPRACCEMFGIKKTDAFFKIDESY